MLSLTDDELVRRCKAELPEDTRSYEILVQRHSSVVFSLVYRLMGNREEAEDVTQEVFLKVYHGLKKFEQQSSFSSWLYRITTNCALDTLEKLKRQPLSNPKMRFNNSTSKGSDSREAEEEWERFQSGNVTNPEEIITLAELRNCISEVLNKMEREQAQVLIMRDVDDHSYNDIATFSKTKLSAIKMRIHRSRLAFQELYKKICDPGPNPAKNTASTAPNLNH